MSIPFRISFDVTFSEEFDIFVDVLFLTDILISFNTAIYINGELNFSRKSIALNYLKLWFWLDLIASFPYSRVVDS